MADTLETQRALAADMQARNAGLQESDSAEDAEVVIGKRVHPLAEANQPAAFHVARGELCQDADSLQDVGIEGCPPRQFSLQTLD